MTGGGRRSRSPAAASPTDNDDLLLEILLRLPPTPSSLPRASLVWKRWRRLVSDPGFLGRFRAHHRRNAPVLGFFTEDKRVFSFADLTNRVPRSFSVTPTLDPPDRIPSGRFSLQVDDVDDCEILGCRRGLVLFYTCERLQVLVWGPVTGEQRRIAFPPGFSDDGNAVMFQGTVLRAPGGVQYSGDSTPFLVVLVGTDGEITQAIACVYSSETGIWGNLISTACQTMIPVEEPSTLVGCSLYWRLSGRSMGILELDLDKQCLAVIDMPLDISSCRYDRSWIIMPAEGGGLGLLYLPGYSFSAQLWKTMTGCDGVARWVLGRTIELDKLLKLNSKEGIYPRIIGFAEEDNVFVHKDQYRHLHDPARVNAI